VAFAAVDRHADDQPRPDELPILNPFPQRHEIGHRQVRAHICRTPMTPLAMYRPRKRCLVRVHVPEARYYIPIPAVHLPRSGRYLDLRSL
jgi:hypothetical protein